MPGRGFPILREEVGIVLPGRRGIGEILEDVVEMRTSVFHGSS